MRGVEKDSNYLRLSGEKCKHEIFQNIEKSVLAIRLLKMHPSSKHHLIAGLNYKPTMNENAIRTGFYLTYRVCMDANDLAHAR